MLLGSLHQGADDVLDGVHAAEEIPLRSGVGFETEQGRVAGMGDKDRDIVTLRHFAGMRGGRIEHDQRRARRNLVDDLRGHGADQPVGNGEDHDVGAADCLIPVDTIDTRLLPQPVPAFGGDFHVVDGVVRLPAGSSPV